MSIDTGASTSVEAALDTRVTVRAFLDRAVPDTLLREIFDKARRTASGGNIQPWNVHVLTGRKLRAFVDDGLSRDVREESRDVTIPHYPANLWEPKDSWRKKVANQLYSAMGIDREDKQARREAMKRNVAFFDAPVGIIITGDRRYDVPQYMDIGIYIQSLMLLARAKRLHTASQGWWRMYPNLARDHLDFPETEEVLVGMAMGYADPDAPQNQFRTDRAELSQLIRFY